MDMNSRFCLGLGGPSHPLCSSTCAPWSFRGHTPLKAPRHQEQPYKNSFPLPRLTPPLSLLGPFHLSSLPDCPALGSRWGFACVFSSSSFLLFLSSSRSSSSMEAGLRGNPLGISGRSEHLSGFQLLTRDPVPTHGVPASRSVTKYVTQSSSPMGHHWIKVMPQKTRGVRAATQINFSWPLIVSDANQGLWVSRTSQDAHAGVPVGPPVKGLMAGGRSD